ncbi:hypothetical protein [Streptomyces sp. R33]|uniref:Uncharacterized protein n=1 Tax=Streptomyces sp. R33 TaxID=3238629 RepID=A0AB39Y8L6_9ACTN
MSSAQQRRKKKLPPQKSVSRQNRSGKPSVGGATHVGAAREVEEIYIASKFKMIFLSVLSITMLCLAMDFALVLFGPTPNESLRSFEDSLMSGFKIGFGAIVGLIGGKASSSASKG